MQVIVQAVMSLPKVYISRNLPADQLRKQNVLSLSQTPQLMLQPTLSGQLPCEFVSLEAMHRWILCKLPCLQFDYLVTIAYMPKLTYSYCTVLH